MPHFLYQLIAPRPSFVADMSDAERTAMGVHAEYWQDQTDRGTCLIFGPVLDPEGPWGLAIVEAGDEDEAKAVFAADPAVTSGVCTYRTAPMMVSAVRKEKA